ncbi:MAG TPA: ParA family protein [Ramlibacter sp.]|uniref:ParA family protein n=1 Tax=Ramlibacter sp. TaxID=1917967 RepID=UPI002B945AF0|nr:ParA family protein [Ramlibacter sp.]HVZ42770.1 ParA family protein [Ramlibacter sp.]
MPVIAVVNRKGGSGKSTFAAHVAAWCARRGHAVMLGDVDRQQSSRGWLRRRSVDLPLISPWTLDNKNMLRVPTGITHAVLDTPGGIHGFELARVVMFADAIVIPVCPSVFDRESAAHCHAELMTLPRVAQKRCRVASVGMRVDGRTNAAQTLRLWSEGIGVEYLGALRETQLYVRSLERGLTIFDLPAHQVTADLAQWEPIVQWFQPILEPPQAANDPAQAKPVVARAHAPRPQNLMPAQDALIAGARLSVLSGAKTLSSGRGQPTLARAEAPGESRGLPQFLKR